MKLKILGSKLVKKKPGISAKKLQYGLFHGAHQTVGTYKTFSDKR